MNRTQLIAKVENRWEEFRAAFTSLTDEQICQAGAFGEWSLKDILGHVATWEEEMVTYLPVMLSGERQPRYKDLYGSIDEFNAMKVAEKRDLTLDEIRDQLEETHQRLIAYLETVPEEHLIKENRIRKRIRYDTYGHYKEHTEAIRSVFGG